MRNQSASEAGRTVLVILERYKSIEGANVYEPPPEQFNTIVSAFE